MYLVTLSKHSHINSIKIMIALYKNHYLIKSRSMTCISLSGLTMSNLVDSMTKDNLDINIIAEDRNLIIMISSMLCYVS